MAGVARPIFGIDAEPDAAVKRRVGPLPNTRDMPVLDRVEVDVVEVTREIVFVAQCVFPVPPLPNPALPFAGAACRDPFGRRHSRRKGAFD